jgi:hypothetical protein
MWAYGVQMKGALPWFVRWARLAGTRNFYPALAALQRNLDLCIPGK